MFKIPSLQFPYKLFSFPCADAVPDGVIVVTDMTATSAFLLWKNYETELGYVITSDPGGAVADTGIISEPYGTIIINFPGTVINITVEDTVTQETLADTLIRSG